MDDPTVVAKRKEFEDLISRTHREDKSVWVNYAKWEESQNDLNRARSIWERAVTKHYRDHNMWMMYGDFEMKNNFVDHARNARDLAVTILPKVDQLWYKYIHIERWMVYMPDQQGWLSYIEFELRYNETERAREIFERFVKCHPKVSVWIRFAKFEMKNGETERARNCYERAVDKLGDDDEEDEQLFMEFIEFEEKYCKETDRARCIYKFALDRIPKGRAHEDLYTKFVAFRI